MKNLIYIPLLLLALISCNSEPSLQKYMAKNSENNNFLALDLGSDILKINQTELSKEEKEALNSFQKLNILAFRKNSENEALYQKEKEEVKSILKSSSSYEELMSFGSGKEGGSVYVLGKDDNINEFVIFGNQNETGFAIIRILGKNMNPNQIMNFMSLLDKANLDTEQLKSLEGFFKKEEKSIPENEEKKKQEESNEVEDEDEAENLDAFETERT